MNLISFDGVNELSFAVLPQDRYAHIPKGCAFPVIIMFPVRETALLTHGTQKKRLPCVKTPILRTKSNSNEGGYFDTNPKNLCI